MQNYINAAHRKLSEALGKVADTDTLAGYEAEMKKSKSFPPEHLYNIGNGQRYLNWIEGKKAAILEKAGRRTHFKGTTSDGAEYCLQYKGHVAREKIVSRLSRWGCIGDVVVTYTTWDKVDRVVRCGI